MFLEFTIFLLYTFSRQEITSSINKNLGKCSFFFLVQTIQKEKDPYFVMDKNAKGYATNTLLSIFSLGKGRESLQFASAFSDE